MASLAQVFPSAFRFIPLVACLRNCRASAELTIHDESDNALLSLKLKFPRVHQIQVMFIILPTTSFQVDPDKTKCTGDDGVSDNIPFVSVNLSFFRLMH